VARAARLVDEFDLEPLRGRGVATHHSGGSRRIPTQSEAWPARRCHAMRYAAQAGTAGTSSSWAPQSDVSEGRH
jgi:hypothetical protein